MQWFEKRPFKALLNSKTLDINLSESKIKQGVFRLLNCIKIHFYLFYNTFGSIAITIRIINIL